MLMPAVEVYGILLVLHKFDHAASGHKLLYTCYLTEMRTRVKRRAGCCTRAQQSCSGREATLQNGPVQTVPQHARETNGQRTGQTAVQAIRKIQT